MCNGDKLLTELKTLQPKQQELKCTVNRKCWCMGVQTRFYHDSGDCMSPQQMLDQTEVPLTVGDTRYLNSLTHLKFIRQGEQ